MEQKAGRPVANAIIAGVNKAGTTSLFVSLSGHPQIASASIKETCYFLPLRWGEPLEPRSQYESYFTRAADRAIRLEATPGYLYGGAPIISAIRDVCGSNVKVIVVLREPVARFVSYFKAQKQILEVPESLTVADYLARADRLSDEDFRQESNLKWFGYRGGCYADFLSPWLDSFGDSIRVVFFEDLISHSSDVLRELATFLDIDPLAYPAGEIASENRTTGFRSRTFQRIALGAGSHFEPFLRRHYQVKRSLRSAYYLVNGRPADEGVSEEYRALLHRRYEEHNANLSALLAPRTPSDLPPWLTGREDGNGF